MQTIRSAAAFLRPVWLMLCQTESNGSETTAGNFNDPVLMMHGECDKIVSYRDSCKFFTSVSSEDKQLKIYGKCYHEIMNEYCKDEVIGDVIRWLENRL